MDAAKSGHPSRQVLSSFGLGKLDGRRAEAVQQHLESCLDCQKQIAELSADSFLGRVRDAQDNDKTTGGAGPKSLAGMIAPEPPRAHTLPSGLADHEDYEVIRELGRGGMGVVYLVENKLMGRKEVLKVVGSHLINRPGVEERFLREIRSAAKLHHTNIVTAYTALRFGESLALAMEYVNGYDLSQLVKAKGPLSVPQACNFAYQAAQGLQHALGHGMVHRDIKPDNLMLTREGKKPIVKVLDFGLAKVTSEGHADSGLTREGQMLGTPLYIAPEQIRDAQSADIRADVYSLGCTLYYLLAGRPPFVGDHVWDVYQAHFSMDANPLNLVRPEVPVELAAIVAKMIAKEPHRRFQTPGEVSEVLAPFFRPAAASPSGSNVNVSRTNPILPPQTSEVGQTPAQPTAPVANPVPSARDSSKSGAEGVAWESLIEIKDDEPLISAVKPKQPEPKPDPVQRPARRPPRVWVSVGAGLLILGLIAAWLGGVLRVKTPDGVIVIEDVPADAQVFVDDAKVNLKWSGPGKPLEIKVVPGQRRLSVRKDGLTVFGERVNVEAGKSAKVTVRLDPVSEEPSDPKQADHATTPELKNQPAPGSAPGVGERVYLSLEAPVRKVVESDWYETKGTVYGRTFAVQRKEYPHGIFAHPRSGSHSELVYRIGRRWRRLSAGVAIPLMGDEKTGVATPLTFQVVGDGRKLWESSPIREFDKPQWFNIDVEGVETLELKVICPGSAFYARAAWLDPCVHDRADPELVSAIEPDHQVAEWVLSRGGNVRVRVNGENRAITPGNDPPTEALQLTHVFLGQQPDLTDADLARFEGLPNLVEFNLSKGPKVTDAGIAHIQNLQRLEVLVLDNTAVTDSGLSFIKRLPALKVLWLRGSHVADSGLVHLEGLTQLKHLALGGSRVTDSGLVHLRGLIQLEHLWLEGTRVADAGLVHLRGLTKLRGLLLWQTRVTDLGAAYLKDLPELEGLMLGGVRVGNDGLASLANVKKLKSLWLDATQVTDAGLVHLQRLPQLKEINLNDTRVTGSGLAHLRDMKLDKLHLSATRVTDEGLVHLRGVTSLQVLVLNRTRVTDAGLVQLKGLTQLKELYLDGTDVTAAGAQELKKSLPGCRIIGRLTVVERPPERPTARLPTGNFIPLFNGRDLEGWNGGVNRQTIDPSRIFRIEGNELVWAGERGTISSDRTFGDFRLKFEYMLPVGQQDRTAFCLLKFAEGDPVRVGQVDFRVGGIFFALSNGRYTKRGGAVLNSHVSEEPAQSVVERSGDAALPEAEWNDAEIRCQGHRITFLINDRQVNSVEANRDLQGCPGFNSWDADIRFRNIRIASLVAEPSAVPKARRSERARRNNPGASQMIEPAIRKDMRWTGTKVWYAEGSSHPNGTIQMVSLEISEVHGTTFRGLFKWGRCSREFPTDVAAQDRAEIIGSAHVKGTVHEHTLEWTGDGEQLATYRAEIEGKSLTGACENGTVTLKRVE